MNTTEPRPPGRGPASIAWDPLRERAREAPGRRAILEADAEGRPRHSWTSGELDAAAEGIAGALRHALADDAVDPLGGGHANGARDASLPIVALFAPPSAAAVAAVHGILRAGAVLAPGHPGWTEAEREAFVDALRPAAVLVAPGLEAAGGAEASGPAEGEPLPAPEGVVPLRLRRVARPASGGLRLGRTRTLLWTSGTSGRPRAVRLSLGAHRASAHGAAARLGLGREDRWLASLALAHVGGLALVFRAAHTGASLVTLPGRFGAAALLRLAAAGEVTHASLVPVMLRRVLEAAEGRGREGGAGGPPPDLRCLLVGGAATDPGLLARALDGGFPVALTYGLTEAASQVATAPPELVRRHPGTVGPPLAGTEVRIAPDGEILVRGPTLMDGYLSVDGTDGRTPDERTPDGRVRDAGAGPAVDADRWLRTGDLGRLDDQGRLWVTGRRSRRIVSGGVTVDPAEVERALAEHPGVAEIAVVGLEDEEWGERLAAAVVPRRRRRPGGPPTGVAGAHEGLRGELEAFARARLSAPRRPRAWAIVDELPRNPNGKPDRTALRALLGRGDPSRT